MRYISGKHLSPHREARKELADVYRRLRRTERPEIVHLFYRRVRSAEKAMRDKVAKACFEGA